MAARKRLTKAQLTERRDKAFKLHLMGATYGEIGRKLEISSSMARRDVTWCLERAHNRIREDGGKQLAADQRRIRKALKKLQDGDLDPEEDDRLVRSITETQTRIAKLFGLDEAFGDGDEVS